VRVVGQKYDPQIERDIRETAEVARDTGSSYKEAKQAKEDQKKDEWRERHGKC